MDHEGLLIEVDQGRVTRIFTSGAPMPGGAAVTYDGADPRLLPVKEPSHADEIERFVTALREARANTQRHGIRVACEGAFGHYQAIAQAAGALANLLADLTCAKDGDPAAMLARVQDAVNRIDDDVLKEVRQQLLNGLGAAMELRVGVDESEHELPGMSWARQASAVPGTVPNTVPSTVHCEPPRIAYPR